MAGRKKKDQDRDTQRRERSPDGSQQNQDEVDQVSENRNLTG